MVSSLLNNLIFVTAINSVKQKIQVPPTTHRVTYYTLCSSAPVPTLPPTEIIYYTSTATTILLLLLLYFEVQCYCYMAPAPPMLATSVFLAFDQNRRP